MAIEFLEDHPAYIGYLSSTRVPYPRGVIVELTSACNLKCIMCPRTAGNFRTQPNRNMSDDVLDLVMVNVLPYVERVDVVGDGEAFLQPGLFFRLLRAANQLRIPMTACSNGHLLRESVLHDLIKHGLHDLNISLDASQPETYERIRKAPFHRVLTHLHKLRHLKRMYNTPHPRLHLTMVALSDNIEEFPSLVELAGELGAASVTLQALGEETEEVEGKSVFHHDFKTVQRVFRQAARVSRDLGIEIKRWPETFQSKEFLGGLDKGQWRKDCTFAWTVPYITTTGDVRPCCAKLPPVGNILDSTFRDIWFGRTYRAVRRHLLAAEPPAACVECPGTGWLPVTPLSIWPALTRDSRHFLAGFHGAEQDDERTFRWFGDRSAIALPISAEQNVYVELAAPPFAQADPQVNVRVNGEPLTTVQLPNGGQWTTVRIPGKAEKDGIAVVEFNVDQTFRPVDIQPESSDARHLAGRLGGISMFPVEQFAQFDDGLVLLGIQLQAQCATGQTVHGRMLWLTTEQPSRDYAAFVHISPKDAAQGLLSFKRFVGGETGKMIQADHQLAIHGRPTSQWETDALVFVDFHAVIPADSPVGEYQVFAGLVPAQGGRRLKIKTSSWKQGASRVELATLMITSGGGA